MSEQPIPLDLEPLPDGWTPLAMYGVVKCLNEDGEVALVTRGSAELTPWECVGMLTAALDSQRQFLQDCFDDEEDA